MTLSELVATANEAIKQGDAAGSIPYLEEIVKRAPTLTDKAALRSVQKVRLQLGRSYAQMEQWDNAEKHIQDYLDMESATDRPGAYVVLCQIAYAKQEWDSLKDSAEELFYDSSTKKPDREAAEMFLAQAHYNLEEYDDAMDYIPLILERTEDAQLKVSFRLMRARSLFETGEGESLLSTLSGMFRGDDQYNVHLNLFLISMGDALFDKSEFRKSLGAYRMVIPKRDVAAWQQTQLDRLEKEQGELEAAVEALTKANQKSKAARTQKTLDALSVKSDALKKAQDVLQKVPDYDVHVAYRVAQIYAEQKRPWDAVAVFNEVYRNYPKAEQAGASLFEMMLLLIDLDQAEEAIGMGREYLKNYRTGLYPRLVNGYLMRHFYRQGETDTVVDLFGITKGWDDPQDEDVRAQETALRYMMCFIWLERSDYKKAAAAFEDVIRFSPDSQSATESHYWRGMCSLMEQDYQGAQERFVQFRSKYPNAALAPVALFRSAVCSFGLGEEEDYKDAQAQFTEFIESYPGNPMMPEALSMRGDLLGGDGKLDEAVADYEQAIELAGQYVAEMPEDSPVLEQVILPATYALSQMAATLELDAQAYRADDKYDEATAKFEEIIAAVENYRDLFGENADLAQAVYLESKSQFQMGQADEAVIACLETVKRFGADPAQKGVDSILIELGNMIKTRLDPEQKEQARTRLRQTRDEAVNPTLQMRLDVLFAELDSTQADLGRELLAKTKALDSAPPSALGLMCSAAYEQRDFSRATELFDFFAEHFDDSFYIKDAYRLLAESNFEQKNYTKTVELSKEALELFGAVQGVGWAQVAIGRCEMAQKKYSDAAETFNKVFNVVQWRGPVHGEAMLLMADAWFAQGNVEKAFAFYQRTYLLYSGYNDGKWAAEAYLKSADCLYKLQQAGKARNTYRAMLLDEKTRDLPQADIAKKVLGPEESVDLLAGLTNSMEKVSTEMKQE